MAYEPKDNTGTLFKNDRKENDSHPNAKGTALIDGVEYWISCWVKDGAKGKFQSLSFQRKEVQGTSKPVQQDAPKRSFRDDLDGDDLPF